MTSATTTVTPRIVLDTRESSLAEALREAKQTFFVEPLLVGDVRIDGADEGGTTSLIIERKTVADLAASIKDGRWREQKERLIASSSSSSGVVVLYVIEGAASFDAKRMAPFSGGLPAAALQSAVAGLFLARGIKVAITRDLSETASLVARLSAKMAKVTSCRPNKHGESTEDTYVAAAAIASQRSGVSACKKENVDPRQCYIQQLCQVPGVSVKTALAIAEVYPGMRALYSELLPLDPRARAKALSRAKLVGPKTARCLGEFMFGAEEGPKKG